MGSESPSQTCYFFNKLQDFFFSFSLSFPHPFLRPAVAQEEEHVSHLSERWWLNPQLLLSASQKCPWTRQFLAILSVCVRSWLAGLFVSPFRLCVNVYMHCKALWVDDKLEKPPHKSVHFLCGLNVGRHCSLQSPCVVSGHTWISIMSCNLWVRSLRHVMASCDKHNRSCTGQDTDPGFIKAEGVFYTLNLYVLHDDGLL